MKKGEKEDADTRGGQRKRNCGGGSNHYSAYCNLKRSDAAVSLPLSVPAGKSSGMPGELAGVLQEYSDGHLCGKESSEL